MDFSPGKIVYAKVLCEGGLRWVHGMIMECLGTELIFAIPAGDVPGMGVEERLSRNGDRSRKEVERRINK